jgi:hypothetical protein
MRSLITRLVLVGIAGAAIAGCGSTSGSSLPAGGASETGGGGAVPVSQQNPASGTEAGLLVDGGTKAYTGFNTTATDTLLTTPAQPKDPQGKTAATDVAGSHSIVYSGNGLTQQIFLYGGTSPNLTLPTTTPGDIMPVDYGALVFFAIPPTSASSLSVELTGGSGGTAYDVRIACTGTAIPTTGTQPTLGTGTKRYVCALPAYGSASSTNLVNPVLVGNQSGTFTPTAPKVYIVANETAALATTSTANTLLLDYFYAEQGTT